MDMVLWDGLVSVLAFLAEDIFGPEEPFRRRLWILTFALLLDRVFCDPVRILCVPHPVIILGRMTEFGERHFNRFRPAPAVSAKDSPPGLNPVQRDLRGAAAGAGLFLGVACSAAGFGWGVAMLSAKTGFWGFEIFLVAWLLAAGSLLAVVRRILNALKQGDMVQARRDLRALVGRERSHMNEQQICATAIEGTAENVSDGVVAPILFFLCFGLAGLFFYKAVNTMDSLLGHRTKRLRVFGKTAAVADDLCNLIPARVSAGLLCLAVFPVCGFRGSVAALLCLWRETPSLWAHLCQRFASDTEPPPSPNAVWPEAVLAGAFCLEFGGRRFYKDEETGDLVEVAHRIQGARPGHRPQSATRGHLEKSLIVFETGWALIFGLILASALSL